MATVRYELRSAPGTFIDVPEAYAREAEALVKKALETPEDLPEPGDGTYFGNMGIWARAQSLAKDTSSDTSRDALYLRVCINRNEKNPFGLRNPQAAELDAALIKLVEQVESQS